MYFYRAKGNRTGKIYHYASKNVEKSPPSNCYPIPETVSDFCEINKEEIDGMAVWALFDADDSGFRMSIPCVGNMLQKFDDGDLSSKDLQNEQVQKIINAVLNDTEDILSDLYDKFVKDG